MLLATLSLITLPVTVICGWNKLPELLPTEEGSLQGAPLGLPEVGHIIAFGHFSPDRRLDCLVLDETRTQVYIYTGSPEGRYKKSLAIATSPAGSIVVNAVLTDVDHDGYADILLMYSTPGSDKVDFKVFLGNGETLTKSQWQVPAAKGQPLLLDWDGSLQLALLGIPNGEKNTVLSVWKNKATSPNELSTGWKSPEQTKFSPVALPNWSSQADLDGDGHADLILMTSSAGKDDEQSAITNGMEIWLRTNNGDATPYKLAMKKSLPQGTGPLAIADVDGDGHLDLIFAVCYPANSCSSANELHIVYNLQRRFCSRRRNDANCRSTDDLLAQSEPFDFATDASGPGHVIIPLSTLFPGQDLRISFEDNVSKTPISISVGDYDLDSYPDLVLTLADRKQPGRSELTRPALLRNVACDLKYCTGDQISANRRTFIEVLEAVDPLRNARQISSVAFADWYGMGPPGFIVNTYSNGQPRHFAIRNGISRDAFSFRVETLNGVCPAPCKHSRTGSRAERPSSVNFVGAMYRFAFVDPSGTTQIRSGMQLGQTSNRALQSPTLLFGLGWTSNFIQTLEVGLNMHVGPTQYSKANIFPNSEIIFIPPHADSKTWTAELQIHPGEYIIYVFISVASALVILAVITGIFKLQERREDELERKKHTHLVNFDAL
jgi:integrin alpha FG-GAP repeat containing protein 1